MKKFINEFKIFIMRGNVLDMAVGVIIGGAFQKIVTSLVNDIIMPIISVITGGINFTDWLHLSAKYAFDYYRTRVENTNGGDGISGESFPSQIKDDKMDRGEENFFESNAEVVLMGDRQLTDNFRLVQQKRK